MRKNTVHGQAWVPPVYRMEQSFLSLERFWRLLRYSADNYHHDA